MGKATGYRRHRAIAFNYGLYEIYVSIYEAIFIV